MDSFTLPYFNVDSFPEYHCPTCGKGILENIEHHLIEDAETKNSKEHPEFGHEWIKYVIQAKLQCNRSKCKEAVLMIGNGYIEEYYDQENYLENHEYIANCKPKYFLPSLKMINISSYVPDDVRNALEQSFSLFFADFDSCGNKIRASLEILLDSKEIPAGKLHRRIENIENIENIDAELEKVKKLLMAIKWLGNAGSHGNEALNQNDLIKAYKIINVVLDIMFKPVDDLTEINSIADSLIETYS